MTAAVKQDSNQTGLRWAQEASIGVLPTTPVWNPLEPNSYNDFGGKYALTARNPINSGRQRKKGVLTDLDASGGLAHDLTQNGIQDLMQGFFFADFRRKAETTFGVAAYSKVFTATNADEKFHTTAHGLATGDGPFNVSSATTLPAGLTAATDYWVILVDVDTFKLATSYANAIAGTNLSISDDGTGVHTMVSAGRAVGGATDKYHVKNPAGFAVGSLVFVAGFATAGNNGLHRISAITNNEFTSASDLTDETAPDGATIVEVGARAGASDLNVDATGVLPALTSTTLNFTTLTLIPGEWIYIGGDNSGEKFVNAGNTGFARIYSIAATRLTFDKTQNTMVTETGTALTISLFFGRVIKNESVATSQVRRSYQLERTLGASDDSAPTQIQSEYLVGAVSDQLGITFKTADKIVASLDYIGTDHETRSGATGVKSGTRPSLTQTDVFNTSNDFARIKMAVLDRTAGANPSALFAHMTDLELTVKNNVSPNKGLATLGAFEMTAGQFEVSGKATAYFASIAGIAAVRANSDVTMDAILVKDNVGIAIDIPLIALGDGRNKVEQDKPIMLDLEMPAGADRVFDHTLLMVFFDYLPTLAG